MLHIRNSDPWLRHHKDTRPLPPHPQLQMPDFENQWDCFQESHRTVENRKPAFKGFRCRLTHPKTQWKTIGWKAPKAKVKKSHFLILKHLLKRQESVDCQEPARETPPVTRSMFKELAHKGVRTSGGFSDRPTIHSQAFVLSSSDAWRSYMFPKN